MEKKTEKSCTNRNCKKSNPQSLSEFYRDRSRTNIDGGYESRCKSCKRAYSRSASRRAARKKYKASKKGKKAAFLNAQTEKAKSDKRAWARSPAGKQSRKKSLDRERKNPSYKLKKAARAAANRAEKSGKLPRIATMTCESCRINPATQKHHHMGYDRSNWLNVQYVCNQCHGVLK